MPTATASTAGTTRTATDNSTDNNTDNGGGGGGSGGGVNNNNISNNRMMYKNKSKRHNRFLGNGKNNGNNNDRIRRNINSITTRYYIFLMFILIGIILQFSTIIKDSSVQTIQQYYNDMPTTITTNTTTTTTVTITASASGASSTIRGVVPDISELSKYMTTTYNNNNNNNDNTNNDENENNDNDDDDDDDEDDDQFAEEEEFEDGGIEPPEFEGGSSQTDDNDNDNDNGNGNDNDNDKNKNENNNENNNNKNNNNFYYNTTYAEMNDPLFNIVPSTYRRNNNNNNHIPNWMKEYFDWHRIQTFKLNETNWNTDTIQTTYKSRKDKDNPNINITIPISIPVPMLSSSTTNNNNNNNTANKFLIIRCLNQDRCGGLSDRIKPLLMFIAVAAHTKRILLIRWERPYPLEEYLIPNEINWTVPFYILEELQKDDYHIKMKRGGQQNLIGMTISRTFLAGPAIHTFIRNNKHSIVEANLQLDDGGARYYQCIVETMLYNNNNSSSNSNSNTTTNNDEYNNSNTTSNKISFKQYKRQQNKNKNKSHVRLFDYSKYKEDYFHCCGKFGDKLFGHYLLDNGIESYKRIYHDFFQSIFKPSNDVQYLIESKMKRSNLVPGQFIGSHYRSDYGPGEAERIGNDIISNSAITQVRCAARMRPGYPVYFAGDSQIAINAVHNDALVLKTKNKNITIITAASDINIDIDTDENNNIDNNNNNNNDTIKNNNKVRIQQQQQQTRSSSNRSGPLHIEFDKGSVEDFYPAFVDLLVMGNSMCQLYGIGGFGSFASLLSYNASCYYSTMKCNGSEGHYLPDKCCMKELYQNNAKSTRIGDARRKRKEQKELAASLNNSTVYSSSGTTTN